MISERFHTASGGRRVSCGSIRKIQALRERRASEILVQEAGIEAVARTDCIDHLYAVSWSTKFLTALSKQGALRTEFYYQHRDTWCEAIDRFGNVLSRGNPASFLPIG